MEALYTTKTLTSPVSTYCTCSYKQEVPQQLSCNVNVQVGATRAECQRGCLLNNDQRLVKVLSALLVRAT